MPLLGFSVSPPTLDSDIPHPPARELQTDRPSVYESQAIISTCKHPVVRLDLDFITDDVAARLATSLLGHVLFLKSQVPFPVAQLFRIPGAKSSARATKQRNELLQTFDTLSSHLITTFTALSTALAQRSSKHDNHRSDAKEPPGLTRCSKDRRRVFLAILVGPSIGSARAKVFFSVDGLETKVWGIRDDAKPRIDADQNHSEEDDDNSENEERREDGEDDRSEDGSSDNCDEEVSDEEHSTRKSSPPPSRSPTPDSEPSSPSPPPPPYTTHAEQQKALHLAERLLARTLAAADANGNSMADEMAPTQTHILLRAPRRFQHPAWIPRQNLSSSMESTLDDFLDESGLPRRDTSLLKKQRTRKGRVEGIWITCRGGFEEPDGDGWKVGDDENDEMIWWSWDGKLTGFSEW